MKFLYRVSLPVFLVSCVIFNACERSPSAKSESGIREIDGIRLYYEAAGKGRPMVLLHGGLGSSTHFAESVPEWSKRYRVIAYDRRGHGRSTDNAEPFSYAAMADEADRFMGAMAVDSAMVVGFSDGAVVGFHLAARYPARVR